MISYFRWILYESINYNANTQQEVMNQVGFNELCQNLKEKFLNLASSARYVGGLEGYQYEL
jgi:hypothetical protein